MNVYASNIAPAIVSLPFIALAITLPYLIHQHRKADSVPWLRTLVVYSFALYLVCACFLVLLPLLANCSAVVLYAQTPQLVPFNFARGFLTENAFFCDAYSLFPTFRNPYAYKALFNVLLLVPLGMYLRCYFRRSWRQTLLIGFLVTLSFEATQITGFWGLYEHPYRPFDVDDLILKTLGAMVGFWAAGPALRVLPDIRLIAMETREAGVRASATRRALSFAIDLAFAFASMTVLIFAQLFVAFNPHTTAESFLFVRWIGWFPLVLFFGIVPVAFKGRTFGQMILKLRIVRPDAEPARWYQIFARYGLLFLFAWTFVDIIIGVGVLDVLAESYPGCHDAPLIDMHDPTTTKIWLAFMALWIATLVVRAVRAKLRGAPFVMLNGVLSNTRVMTEAGVTLMRKRKLVLDVDEVRALEGLIAKDGTPLSELMERAGRAVAEEVRAWVPDPAPVVVLAGAGNNGGDGWVCARMLAEEGYPVTLVTPDIAERMKAEPARSTALAVLADAARDKLPLRVLVAPSADILDEELEGAQAVVDAVLGTGFSGEEVREPYASWIRAANRRRFEGARGAGRGSHRKRACERGDHERRGECALVPKAHDAPFAVSIDVPSGLSAQTGRAARPCFFADLTVTMLAFKPGLSSPAPRACGVIRLATLVDVDLYLERLRGDGHKEA
ncbi:carbohydrate kinase [Gordonibacter sp. An230]|uniref:NAD(P)H-hydrate epimerase n=1 Tax=Gordonibacter sp. An230 TaxID=1965592 RepID=UPI000B3739B6|nr:NAD(P)H-hydrate epimerase [Gordonibacter sp. An230]OUO90694.1 carbohydrate kinase [Gordonibacter sp. An230]